MLIAGGGGGTSAPVPGESVMLIAGGGAALLLGLLQAGLWQITSEAVMLLPAPTPAWLLGSGMHVAPCPWIS